VNAGPVSDGGAPHGDMAEVTTIFQQPWWLEATAPGAWGAVEIVENGRIVARHPYALYRRLGMARLSMPPLTQTLGPWIAPAQGRPEALLSREHALLGELLAKLPRHDLYSQAFHHSLTNWLPFYWRGFTQTTRYTYLLDLSQPGEKIWAGMRDKTRNTVRKAERTGITVAASDDVDLLAWLCERTLERHGVVVSELRSLVRRVDEAARRRGASRLLVARGSDGVPHCAVYCIHDRQACYNLLQGADPAFRSSGAAALAVWQAVRYAAGVSATFDFEGSMLRPVEHFVRSFAARQTPYFYVRRESRRLKLLSLGRELLRLAAPAPAPDSLRRPPDDDATAG